MRTSIGHAHARKYQLASRTVSTNQSRVKSTRQSMVLGKEVRLGPRKRALAVSQRASATTFLKVHQSQRTKQEAQWM